jgi:hypothetical protein
MKKLQDYLSESEQWIDSPSSGDHFDIELEDDTLLETYVIGVDQEGGILLDSNEQIFSLLESWNMLEDDIDTDVEEDIDGDTIKKGMSPRSTNDLEEMAPLAALAGRALAHAAVSAAANRNNNANENRDPGEYDQEGDMAKDELATMIRAARKLTGMLDNDDNMPEWTQKKINKATDYVDTAADYISSQKERGVMEQSQEDSPVARATLHRIMMRHPGMLAQHGPERVMQAVDDVADLVGDMDDIGTSDVSGWVNMVQEILDSLDQGVAEGSEEDFENWKKTIAPKAAQSAIQKAVNVRAQKQALAKAITQNDINRALKQKGVAEGSLNEAATMASVSKLLRHIERHHPTWFDDYGMGEVEDAVVDMAEQGQFSGMTVVDAAALVGQELESMYGADGMNEGSLNEDLQADNGERYRSADDFFGQFEADWFDEERVSDDGMEIRGYIDGVNVMAWRYDSPRKTTGYGVYDDSQLSEAEYQGRKVQLGKPTRGDVKKFKVYVRDPSTGNVKKVNFGDPNMRIKKSDPARRKSFRARHNCDNPGPRTKARYWSCRKW